MNVVFLSPYFPSNWVHFAAGLKLAGANVLGLGDESYDKIAPELKATMTEYYQVSDLHNYAELQRALGYFTWKYGKIDRVESHNEYWLETDAKLRTDFNIYGVREHQLEAIKNKSGMKQVYLNAGLNVARGRVVLSAEEARAFVEEVGYPIVAKPDIGVGAAKTYKLESEDDLNFFLEDRSNCEYIMEEFVVGDLYSFDGLTDKEGNILFWNANYFCRGVMETVNKDLDIYYHTCRYDLPDGLLDAGMRTVKAFDVRERFFHFEYFVNKKDGRIVCLEVNMRPPGGVTMDMFNYACDINLYHEWGNLLCGRPVLDGGYAHKYYASHIGRKVDKPYIHTHEEIRERFGHCIVTNHPISGVFRGALGDYVYVARTENLDQLMEVVAFIQAKY